MSEHYTLHVNGTAREVRDAWIDALNQLDWAAMGDSQPPS